MKIKKMGYVICIIQTNHSVGVGDIENFQRTKEKLTWGTE